MNKLTNIDKDGFSKVMVNWRWGWGLGEVEHWPITRFFAEVSDRGKLIRRPAWGERRVI